MNFLIVICLCLCFNLVSAKAPNGDELVLVEDSTTVAASVVPASFDGPKVVHSDFIKELEREDRNHNNFRAVVRHSPVVTTSLITVGASDAFQWPKSNNFQDRVLFIPFLIGAGVRFVAGRIAGAVAGTVAKGVARTVARRITKWVVNSAGQHVLQQMDVNDDTAPDYPGDSPPPPPPPPPPLHSGPCYYQRSCNAGHFLTNDCSQCSSCLPGTASQGKTNSYLRCDVCEAGKYSQGYQNSVCQSCPTGYNSGVGATTCTATSCSSRSGQCVSDGFFIMEGCSKCQACNPGTASNGVKNLYKGCTQCPAGKFSPGYQATSCVACPAGQTSGVGASSCTGGANKCASHLTCNAGYYVNTDCKTCSPCKRGTASGDRNRQYAECETCPAGKYQMENAGTTCNRCPAGTTSSKGQISCTGGPAPAPSPIPGTSPQQYQCKAAEAWMNYGAQTCKLICPAGKKIDIRAVIWGDLFVGSWPDFFTQMSWNDGSVRKACFDIDFSWKKVTSQCDYKNGSCDFVASVANLGVDPCPQVRKNLFVRWLCV